MQKFSFGNATSDVRSIQPYRLPTPLAVAAVLMLAIGSEGRGQALPAGADANKSAPEMSSDDLKGAFMKLNLTGPKADDGHKRKLQEVRDSLRKKSKKEKK